MAEDIKQRALTAHKKLRGKISLRLKDSLDTQDKLSTYYTPGVAAVSSFIAAHHEQARDYTSLNNTVAIVSDGSAVLGLGNIGPLGALPVMEGKAMLFKHFADIDAWPIVLSTQDTDEIVAAVRAIAPSFGGINLEDIAAPACFEIERRLKQELSIPLMHDDQHGTAVVVLAGLINAFRVTGRKFAEQTIAVVGAGAAGHAIARLLHQYNPGFDIRMVDSQGIITRQRTDINSYKRELADFNKSQAGGGLTEAVAGADVFIGVSKGGLLKAADVKSMAKHPIIFAMANPDPEILPVEAKRAGAAVVATGRSDFPNQVNNALAFPGIFRGALDNRVHHITDQHKVATAEAMAQLVKQPTADTIIPAVFERSLVSTIARVIK